MDREFFVSILLRMVCSGSVRCAASYVSARKVSNKESCSHEHYLEAMVNGYICVLVREDHDYAFAEKGLWHIVGLLFPSFF